ncbi:MAG: flavohemoglobin expression-modulating QEGLA motif protein [Candidatus Eisenbacteria bacterium]|nr:flavohemoglobin expression-modulating QEGLA motif protein [Candidatus Eisenbacteria bacterium]
MSRTTPNVNPGFEEFSDRDISTVIQRLAENKRVRRKLPIWGRIHIDRLLPFLCVYRRPIAGHDHGTDRLVLSEAAYLNAPGEKRFQRNLANLVERLASLMIDRFGAFLVLELWSEKSAEASDDNQPRIPCFRILHPPDVEIESTIRVLQEGLMALRAAKQRAVITTQGARKIAPPGMMPLLPVHRLQELGGYILGLEIKPVYSDPESGDVYPLVLRAFRRQLSHILDRAFFEFTRKHTTHHPPHFHSLGRRAVVKAVWDVDRALAAVSDSFDFLYQVTPMNTEEAWKTFQRKGFEKEPVFIYRPSTIDPGLVKRDLYGIRMERIEDPTLLNLFMGKQMELDRQLTMLNDLGTKKFMYASLQLHGDVSTSLVNVAKEILEGAPRRSRGESAGGGLTAPAFAEKAAAEIARYVRRYPEFKAKVQVSNEMYSGLLVSRGKLLVGKETRIPAHRADALIQHEIGTHLLTYYNGQAQPFKMLYTGLPGYDELQEGLAVLAEYLVGGLTSERMRVLAARVMAARALIDGATFVEVFRLLERTYEFSRLTAYTITMRVFRGGGFTKDAHYLRGLRGILNYLASKGDFEILFVGKIARTHVGVIKELLLRQILKPPPLYPHYLETPMAQSRLETLRRGLTVLDLMKKK